MLQGAHFKGDKETNLRTLCSSLRNLQSFAFSVLHPASKLLFLSLFWFNSKVSPDYAPLLGIKTCSGFYSRSLWSVLLSVVYCLSFPKYFSVRFLHSRLILLCLAQPVWMFNGNRCISTPMCLWYWFKEINKVGKSSFAFGAVKSSLFTTILYSTQKYWDIYELRLLSCADNYP